MVRFKQGTNHALEEAQFGWVLNQQAKRVNISGDMICTKAQRIQFQVNERRTDAEKATLKFSDGWLIITNRAGGCPFFGLTARAEMFI